MSTSETSVDVHEHVAVEYWGKGMLEGGLSNLGTVLHFLPQSAEY